MNYYEHIIRTGQKYLNVYKYIEINLLRWEEDKYYVYFFFFI